MADETLELAAKCGKIGDLALDLNETCVSYRIDRSTLRPIIVGKSKNSSRTASIEEPSSRLRRMQLNCRRWSGPQAR